jgi:hypothetical protein
VADPEPRLPVVVPEDGLRNTSILALQLKLLHNLQAK